MPATPTSPQPALSTSSSSPTPVDFSGLPERDLRAEIRTDCRADSLRGYLRPTFWIIVGFGVFFAGLQSVNFGASIPRNWAVWLACAVAAGSYLLGDWLDLRTRIAHELAFRRYFPVGTAQLYPQHARLTHPTRLLGATVGIGLLVSVAMCVAALTRLNPIVLGVFTSGGMVGGLVVAFLGVRGFGARSRYAFRKVERQLGLAEREQARYAETLAAGSNVTEGAAQVDQIRPGRRAKRHLPQPVTPEPAAEAPMVSDYPLAEFTVGPFTDGRLVSC